MKTRVRQIYPDAYIVESLQFPLQSGNVGHPTPEEELIAAKAEIGKKWRMECHFKSKEEAYLYAENLSLVNREVVLAEFKDGLDNTMLSMVIE